MRKVKASRMFLIRKGEKPRPICRDCRKVHGREGCQKRRVKDELYEAAKEFHDWAMAFNSRITSERMAGGK